MIPSGSCADMITHQYEALFNDDPLWLEKAHAVSGRCREFKVDNAANFRWIDVNGRIIGTQTDTRPAGIDPRLLVTLP